MTPEDLLATCVADEAGGEPYEGKVAVAIVLANRMALPYQSDGTAEGTVLKKDQFSGFWFDMIEGKYTRVCSTLEEAQARAQQKYDRYFNQSIWDDCVRAVADASAWVAGEAMSFAPGPAFAGLTPRTVLYLNPQVSHAAWATDDKQDAVIYHHTFFHDH
jgi:spore germination cell wall hydrolase CwlJ-like protein